MALATPNNSVQFTFKSHCVSASDFPTFFFLFRPLPLPLPHTFSLLRKLRRSYMSTSSPANGAVNMHNQAGRDNVITQSQTTTTINDRSVWFLILVSVFLIVHISKKRKVAKRLEELQKILRPRMIENASYNDQKKRPCETGTREDVLQEIISWIEDVSKEAPCFYWLSGEPGVGKSAITTSIVKYCIDRNILGAQFFINRDDTTTTDPAVLFPSICWQLCKYSQRVATVIEQVLRARPTLVDDISFDQATKLFVKAIETSAAIDQSRPIVIVIDALDETDTKRLGNLAQILSRVVTDLPRNAKVFISSRTEDPITTSFNSLRDLKQVKSRHLAAKDSIDEVSRFMEEKMKEILLENKMDWEDWKDDIRRISSQASGLYIWAETALKLLRAEIEDMGTACFKGLLDMLKTKGVDDINTLYLTILRRTCKDGNWEHQRFRRIIGAIIVRQTPLSIADMAQLLDLREPHYSQPVDVVHFVRRYRTVLVKDTKEIDGFIVPRMHKSFVDFVTSEWAQEFRVDLSASHGENALQCMNQLDDLRKYLKQEKPSFPSQLVYASQYWQSHLTRMIEHDGAGEKEEYDTPDIPKNDTQNLPDNSRAVQPETEIEGKGQSIMLFVAFSPDGTRFALAHGRVLQIRDARTGLEIMSLTGHKAVDGAHSIGFSPDGTQLVLSRNATTTIWDTRTGREPYVLHGYCSGAAFSHDGRTLATGAWDMAIRTWDSNTGQQLNEFKGREHPVRYCIFSLDDQHIASFSADNQIRVWDVNSGNMVFDMLHPACYMVVLCPCGGHIMSGDTYGIQLWDIKSGKQLHRINSTDARLALRLVDDTEQRYIEVPPALSTCSNEPNPSIPHFYVVDTPHGAACGIMEHGRGVWQVFPLSGSVSSRLHLHFTVGSTKFECI